MRLCEVLEFSCYCCGITNATQCPGWAVGGPRVFCACVPQGISKETSGILKNKKKETELRFPGAVFVGASWLWGCGEDESGLWKFFPEEVG